MNIPFSYQLIIDGALFEEWLKFPTTDDLLSEISYEINIPYSLYFKDYPNDKIYAHPIVSIIFRYWSDER